MALGVGMRRVVLDVSSFQGNVDFVRVKAESPEVVGVIIKATEGQWNGTNPNFDEQYTSARAAGLMVGFYCFDHTSVNASSQASLYLSKVSGKPAELGHWLDFEANDAGAGAAAVQAHVSSWLTTVDAARTELVGVYSAPWAWDPWTGSMDASHYPLWLAGYTSSLPSSPAHWGRPLMWQFTDAYPCYFGQCDASVILDDAWNPSEDDLTPDQANVLNTCAKAIVQLGGAVTQIQGSITTLINILEYGDSNRDGTVDHVGLIQLQKQISDSQAAVTAAIQAVPAGSGGTVDTNAVAEAVVSGVKGLAFKAS